MSRLKLNFSLTTYNERLQFINLYLPTLPNPTSEELETIANYLLWSSSSATLSPRKELKGMGILPPSKNSEWDEKVESIEALRENPAVEESDFHPLSAPQVKLSHEPFSRSKARQEAPQFILEALEALFTQIDTLDFQIESYELEHGKRSEPIRKALLERLEEGLRARLAATAATWSQHQYLKARHLLIQLRSEQYMFRDSYKKEVGNSPTAFTSIFSSEEPTFGIGIQVLPLGLKSEKTELLFRSAPSPSKYTIRELEETSKLLWREKENQKSRATRLYFDFGNQDHVYQLLLLERFLRAQELDEGSTVLELIETLEFYIGEANLTDAQREILELKRKHTENLEIASIVNKKYGKNYSQNYISTIFKQKIIPRICDAAALHLEKVEKLFFEEEFKKCSCCGRELLRSETYFMKKVRSLDGLNGRCKDCDREKRKEKKLNG